MKKTTGTCLASELRSFAPIGMMEHWNTGIMGLKEFFCNYYVLLLPLFPIFQHSSIPVFHGSAINQELFKDH